MPVTRIPKPTRAHSDAELERQYFGDLGWQTVEATSNGGSQPLGVWKEYGVDSNNQAISGVTVGDGSLVGKWWTPGTVVPSVDTDPFLCTIIANFRLGTTSTVDGSFGFALPRIVDGLPFNIAPADTFEANGFAEASGIGDFPGAAIGDADIIGADGVSWDATHPFVWADAHNLMISVTFLARFAAD